MHPLWYNSSKIAIARAAPSFGSVPLPISSNNKRVDFELSFIIPAKFLTWDEKVLRAFSILWLSPISTNILLNTEISVPSSAGIWNPDCTASVNIPTVFKTTVFPPAFGPVIISVL